jgi:hypothetical protein
MKRLMVMSILGAAMAMGWASPARADVPNDDCGGKKAGDACSTFDAKTGVCAAEDGGGLVCDTTADTTGGCAVGSIGADGRAEAAALGLLFAACVAMRRRRA